MTSMSVDHVPPRRRVELVAVPLMATLCMIFIIGAIVLDKNGGACPAVSWSNKVTLALSGNPTSMATASAVTACTGINCKPADPRFAKSSSDVSELLMRQSDGTWVYSPGSASPANVTFKVFDSNGQVLAERAYSLNWTRIGGSEQCGGPMAAMSVPLQLG